MHGRSAMMAPATLRRTQPCAPWPRFSLIDEQRGVAEHPNPQYQVAHGLALQPGVDAYIVGMYFAD